MALLEPGRCAPGHTRSGYGFDDLSGNSSRPSSTEGLYSPSLIWLEE
jgi:hypothetical protein